MRMSIYRITIFISLLFIGLNITSAQSTAEGVSPHTPHCGFDEMMEHDCLHDEQLQIETRDFLNNAIPALSAQSRSAVEPLLTIPVVVHIIHSGEPVGQGSNISDQQIFDQIAVLNEDFCAINEKFHETPAQWLSAAGVPNIQFLLANTDPNGSPTNGITRHNIDITGSSWNSNNINSEIKPAVNWNPDRYMNIYVLSIPGTTAAGGVVGFSNYPTASQVGAERDGPVIDFHWFGGPGHPVSGWRAISHETGHYLGLPHPFNGTSCSSDDNIDDTPNIDDATSAYMTLDCSSEFPVGPSSCGNDHMFVNFMDYVTENCYTSFTQGQINIMRSVLDGTSSGLGYGSREDLMENAANHADIPVHDVGITRIIAPEQINCTPNVLTPTVVLRNFGSADLTKTQINYRINNGPITSFIWQGNLFPGESTEVTLTDFMPPNGQYEMSFFTTEPNDQPDDRTANDAFNTEMFTHFAFKPPLIELAEGSTTLPTALGTYEINFGNDNFKWQITGEASSYGFGLGAFMFDNRAGSLSDNPSDTYDLLVTQHFDFTDVTDAALYFDVSYATYNSIQVDTLYILVATGCSQNFNTYVYKKWGDELATAPPTQNTFIPMSQDWRTEGVDLSYFDGMDDVTIGFLNVSNWGNRLYLDNIRVGVDCAQLKADWTITPDGCNNAAGVCTGEAAVEVPISNGDIRYFWKNYPPQYNESFITDACPGEVEVTILDEFGCEITVTNEIPAADPPILSTSSQSASGYQTSDGTATVNIDGGTPPYFIEWDNGDWILSDFPFHTIYDLAAGEYEVLVIDAASCQSTLTVSVESACANFAATTINEDALCYGLANGYSSVSIENGTAPFDFAWSDGFDESIHSNLPAGDHSVLVTDANGCPFLVNVEIEQPDELVLNTSQTNETTANAMNGTASVSVEGGTQGYSYIWSNGEITPFIDDLPSGIYTVTVTDANNCQSTESVFIQSVDCDDFQTTITWENLTCYQSNDGTANVTVTGETPPVIYIWSNGGMDSMITNLTANSYTVTVTDDEGCSAELSANVQEPTELTVDLTSTKESMMGTSDGTATAMVEGGIPLAGGIYHYEWSNGDDTETITMLSAGTYIVTITDFNDCTVIDSIIVGLEGIDCDLSIQMESMNASCPTLADGTATVTSVQNGVMPFMYNWSNGGNTAMVENLLPDNYTVTVTDAQGCTVNGWVPISGNDVTPPTLMLMEEFTLVFENDPLVFSASMIDQGSFDNCSMINLVASQTSFDCDEVGENQVLITATDSDGNMAEETVTIIIEDGIPPVLSCPDDLTIVGCDGVEYDMITATDNCTVQDITLTEGFQSGETFPNGATTVTWQAEDDGGNVGFCSFEVFIENDFQLTNSIIMNPVCAGDANGYVDLFIAGGMSPYQTLWSHGGGPTNLSAGVYTVTITDANGCDIEETFELMNPPPFDVSLVEIIPAMGGNPTGSIQVSISGGATPFVIEWFENGVLLPGFDPFNAPPGTYSMTATDYNGCERELNSLVVDNLNSTSDVDFNHQVSLYPNPTSNFVFLKIDSPIQKEADVSFYDVNGKVVLQKSKINTNTAIELSNLNTGVFWVKIQIGHTLVWKKLILI